MKYISKALEIFKGKPLTTYATFLIILMGVCWLPLEGRGGLGVVKVSCMISAVIVLIFCCLYITKALLIGLLYLSWQFVVAFMHPETYRASTLYFSVGLVLTYICFYNLLYVKHVFTIHHFIKLCEWIIVAFFIVCIVQQMCILAGITYLPAVNLIQELGRGIGCNSLSMEPSTFARTMLVFYYAYIKCNEYIRGRGRFTIVELFNRRYRWITVFFLWMMCTMGSGTAFICLMAFSLYFINSKNWLLIIPIFAAIFYIGIPSIDSEELERATRSIEAATSLDNNEIIDTDVSAAARITPYINSIHSDFSDPDVWFGHGIDYAKSKNLYFRHRSTLFDDYGLIFYIISMIFNISCAYRFKSLSFIFLILGIAGGAGGNIHYAWWLMMVITGVKYFYDQKKNGIKLC